MFGRKGTTPPPPAAAPLDGYVWVDRHLARYDQPGSIEFAHDLGLRLFDSSYKAMQDERGVRIEAIVAMLSSVGGHLCLYAVLDALAQEQCQPADIGMLVATGADGHDYYFGDAPNRLLCESEQSLLSLVFGAAHQHGGAVSIDMIHAEMKLLAGQIGTAQFLELDLPAEIAVEAPLRWAHHFTRFVIETVGKHFIDSFAGKPIKPPAGGLAPLFLMPKIVGFAVQQAIDVGHQALDPTMLARVAMGCSMRTAKLDPAWVHAAEQ